MQTKHITTWRKHNDVLLAPMTLAELKSKKTKAGMISAKLVIDFNFLVDNDLEGLNDEMSARVTNSICGLTDISYKVMGNTADNELIVKVTGNVDDHITDEE